MYSAPSTPEQQAYYSTHAPKRKVYGLAQTGLQIAHIALAFAAWQAIFGWAFRNLPAMQLAVPFLAVGTLALMHIIWRTTWDTFWYDRLDGRSETDSSPFLPIAIMLVLVLTEKQGATLFFTEQVAKPTTTDTRTLDEQLTEKTASLDAQYERDKSRLEEVWDAKTAAVAAPFERNISGWQRRKATSEADRQFIQRNIATFQRQRDAAVAKASEGKAVALEHLLANHNQRRGDAESRSLSLLGQADAGNIAEFQRYQSDLSAVHGWAWLISLFFVGCAAALGYARVRINVRSGILPERTYSTLDQHGSALEKLWIALADGFARQFHVFAVGMHRSLSPSKAITDFDGRVVIAEGGYNAPSELRHPDPPPPPPSKGERLMRDRFRAAWKRYCETGEPRDRAEAGGERRELYDIHGIVGAGRDDGSVFFQKTTVPAGQLETLYPLPRVAPSAALVGAERPAIILSSDDEPEAPPVKALNPPVKPSAPSIDDWISGLDEITGQFLRQNRPIVEHLFRRADCIMKIMREKEVAIEAAALMVPPEYRIAQMPRQFGCSESHVRNVLRCLQNSNMPDTILLSGEGATS